MRRTGLSRAIALAVLAAAAVDPAAARDVTDAEKAALARTIAAFDAATQARDLGALIGTLPPSILASLATESGVSVEMLTDAMAVHMRQAMDGVLLVSFGMDFAGAAYAELADGMPYALIPTETVMEIPGVGKIKAVSETLALMEEGAWYLLRIEANELPIRHLQQVYPGFADVEFTPGTLEEVE